MKLSKTNDCWSMFRSLFTCKHLNTATIKSDSTWFNCSVFRRLVNPYKSSPPAKLDFFVPSQTVTLLSFFCKTTDFLHK